MCAVKDSGAFTDPLAGCRLCLNPENQRITIDRLQRVLPVAIRQHVFTADMENAFDAVQNAIHQPSCPTPRNESGNSSHTSTTPNGCTRPSPTAQRAMNAHPPRSVT